MASNNGDYIPRNRSSGKRIGMFHTRKLIEALIFTGLITAIIWILPLILKAKLVFTGVFGGISLVFNLMGVRNKSITQAFMLYLRHLVFRRGLRLGSVNDGIKENKFKGSNGSYAEKIREYFDDKNLNAEDAQDDIVKQLAKFAKQFFKNITDNIG